jgi:hypothetical protein
MCRQRVARDRIGIGQAREVVAEMALRERRQEARFQAVARAFGGFSDSAVYSCSGRDGSCSTRA